MKQKDKIRKNVKETLMGLYERQEVMKLDRALKQYSFADVKYSLKVYEESVPVEGTKFSTKKKEILDINPTIAHALASKIFDILENDPDANGVEILSEEAIEYVMSAFEDEDISDLLDLSNMGF